MKKVLILEDDPALVDALRFELGDLECEIKITIDGASGVQVQETKSFKT